MKNLQEIIEPLTELQQDFLYYQLMGLPKADAAKLLNIHGHMVRKWSETEEFEKVSSYVLENREKFKAEAPAVRKHYIMLKVGRALENLVDMSLKWGELDKYDKPYCMRALELMAKIVPTTKDSTYEDSLLKLK